MLFLKSIRCCPILLLVLLAWTPNVQSQTISSNWLTASDGKWQDQANWSTGVFPNNDTPNLGDQYDVVIDAAGAGYTVDIFDTTAPFNITINSLTLDSPDVTFEHLFTDLVVDSINLIQGTYEFRQGSIVGATISGGGDLQLTSNGLLKDVILETNSVSVTGNPRISGDLLLNGTNGTDILFSNSGSISFSDTTPQAILGSGKLQFTAGTGSDVFASGGLTITPMITIESLAGTGEIRNGELVNNGVLRSAVGSTLNVIGEEFENNGAVDVGGTFRIGRDSDSRWTNNGTITLRPDSRLLFTGTFTRADLGIVVDEGAREVINFGVWDNTGEILDLSNLGFDAPLTLGTVKGGRVIGDAGTEIQGTLDGITIGSNLALGTSGSRMSVTNGLTLDNVTLSVFQSTSLSFIGSQQQTLGGTGTILITNSNTRYSFGGQLIIGENISIRNVLENQNLELSFSENRGTIVSEAIDGRVKINERSSTTWTNSGTILASGGTVVIDGLLQNTGRIQADRGSTFQIDVDLWTNEGQIELDGGEVEINAMSLFRNATTGTISGNGNIVMLVETLRNNGTISPDGGFKDPTGLLTVDGDVTLFDTSVFELEIGGADPCDFDAMEVSGRLRLGGSLNVSFMDGFTLGSCHEFVFASGEDVSGEFTGLPEGTLVGQVDSRDFFITYTAGDGNDVAIFSPVLLGDVNSDQTVDFSDISPFIMILAAGGYQAEADIDQSGEVDFSDISPFIEILSSFGL
ncbi:hypothetical protein N9Y42_06290 [Mariniblastus sp.]|nr:hypothetical protein [Mariniblastus sp.]